MILLAVSRLRARESGTGKFVVVGRNGDGLNPSEDDFRKGEKKQGTTPENRGRVMYWFFLVLAGIFEMGWAVGLKYAEGFTRFWPSVLTLGLMAISVVLLALSMRHLPVGTAYAVWTGIGSVGTVLSGIILFGESASVERLFCIGLILAGIVGLKLVSGD